MAGHRATLKKAKKSFKSGHASKRSLKAKSKGKVEKKSGVPGPKSLKRQSKLERKNTANQLKKNKILKSLNKRALFDVAKTEKIVTFIPLTRNISCGRMLSEMLKPLGEVSVPEQVDGPLVKSVHIERFKSNLKIVLPDMTSLISILDAAKIADFVILGLSATEEVEPKWGEQIVRAIEAQGISSVYGIVPDVVCAYPLKKNLQDDILKSLSSYYGHFFPDYEKLFVTERPSDALNLLRSVCQKLPRPVSWRDERGYMVADSVNTAVKEGSTDEGYLVIEGTVRGAGFSADNLVSLPDVGEFAIGRIEKLETRKVHQQAENEGNCVVFAPGTEKDTLDELGPLSEAADEQDEDMMEDEDSNFLGYDQDNDENTYDLVDRSEKSNVGHLSGRKLPKGMSAYQAKWLLDDDIKELVKENGVEEEDTEDVEQGEYRPEDAFEAGEQRIAEGKAEESSFNEADGMDVEPEDAAELSAEEEARQLQEFKKKAKEELEFPDEIELRPTERATERLSRYRGVKSLADCLWDYDEPDAHRPSEWLRYLRVKNYRASSRRIRAEFRSGLNVRAGDRCRLYVDVPASVLSKLRDPSRWPFVVYELLKHEHKLTVCQIACKIWESYDLPLKSKERMFMQYGARRVEVEPIFSQPSRNTNNVAKFLRFLQKGASGIATVVAPMSFTNSPVLFYRQTAENGVELVADGTFLNADFTRIVAKRSVLTGEVLKIHKSAVTVRYMFFNEKDVHAFRNVPLFTQMGHSGTIKQSLGTHGYFKATFDGKINAQDVIAMALYKRMWPRNCVHV